MVEYWLRMSIVTNHWPGRKLGNTATSLEPYLVFLLYELKSQLFCYVYNMHRFTDITRHIQAGLVHDHYEPCQPENAY